MNKLMVGFGRADITPQHSVPLRGYGNNALRYSQTVLDPLYVTCLAFTDDAGETALLLAIDMIYAEEIMRQAACEATGLPPERVHVSGSHTHAGPDLLSTELPGVAENTARTLEQIRQAAREALADRKPAEPYVAQTHTQNMNFVRQYLMADGTYAGPSFGNFNQPIVAHETEADDQLQLVKLVREGGKDIIIANFQAHQTMTGGLKKHDISADYSGAMRAKMEQELDCCFAFLTGPCGNVTPTTRIDSERRFENSQYIEYGRTLADYAIEAGAHYRKVNAGPVKVKRLPLDIDVNHSLDHMEDIARSLVKRWKETGDYACNELCRQHGLNSVYHAESVLDKLSLGKTWDIELNVISIGDVAFVIMPYEVYDTNGMQIKAASPYESTILATCATNERSYIPSGIAFEHGGYTVDRCRFVPGTGERLARDYISMLEELHENKS